MKRPETRSPEDHNLILKGAQHQLKLAAVRRLSYICLVLTAAHITYAFQSIHFLQQFDPGITLSSNFLARFFLCALPFLLLAWFLRKSSVIPSVKIQIYIWAYSILFMIAACIYVWPLALNGHPNVLLYVAGVNAAYLCSTWSLAALPRKFFIHIVSSMFICIVIPVGFISYSSGGIDFFMTIMGDLLFAATVGPGLGALSARIYSELEYLRAEHRHESAKYLGEHVTSAIFEKRQDLIEEKICTAYIVVCDIRGSTMLTKKYGAHWAEFINAWLTEANEVLRTHGGTFIKSTGDGFLAAFGLFDEEDIVRDLPGLSQQNKEADENRWVGLTVDTFSCLDLIMRKFETVSNTWFPHERIRMACGLDRGRVHRGVRGGRKRLEFDIWGDKVNVAAKLESFSKSLTHHFDPEASLLIVSPFATDFLENLDSFKRIEMDPEQQQHLGGIRWVLVRTYNVQRARLKLVA